MPASPASEFVLVATWAILGLIQFALETVVSFKLVSFKLVSGVNPSERTMS